MLDLPNLDFLRAWAVISVVAEHMLLACGVKRVGPFPADWLGVVGVFLFFVHTSLVLMWSLERKPHPLDFYIRRVFRVYPLAILAIGVVVLTHAPVAGNPTSYFVYVAPQKWSFALATFLLINNLHGSYLPMSVLWSLPYEVDMYVFLPALFFFVQKNFTVTPLLALWVFLVMLNHATFGTAAHNFFLTVPYFLPGVMAYIGFSRRRATLPAWLFPFFLAAIWLLFLLRPTWRGGNLVCLAAGLGLPLFQQIRSRWLKRASHTVARYSYGLYLSHPFAIVLGIYFMPHAARVWQVAVCLISMTGMSVAAYHWMERPMIRLGSRLARRAESRFEQKQLEAFRIPEAEIH